MDPLVVIVVSCLILGSVVGILAGMLGIGGGLFIVPALSFLLINFLRKIGKKYSRLRTH